MEHFIIGLLQEKGVTCLLQPYCVLTSCNSGSDVFDRVSTFLETLYRDMSKGGCGDNAILVSHGLFCRLFLTRFYHWSVCDDHVVMVPCYLSSQQVEKFHKLWNFDNCQFAVMELQKDGYYKLITQLQSD